MKISVITANLNNESTLADTIASVVGQTHRPIEMIIVDGGSTDGSTKIIDEAIAAHPDIVRCITDTTPGVYHAINQGIRSATGDVIGLLHGNDVYTSPDILSQVAGAFDKSGVDFIYGDIHYTDQDTGKTLRRYCSSDFTPDCLLDCLAPPHPSLFMTRHTADVIGPYREDYVTAADFEMFVRLFCERPLKCRHLDLDMVSMSLGGMSTSLRHRLLTNMREKRRALIEHGLRPSLSGNIRRIIKNLLTLIQKPQ